MAAGVWLDIGSSALVAPSLPPAAMTTSTYGTAVDLLSAKGNMASALLEVGAVSGTQGTCTVKVQENAVSTATDPGWTDIPGATFAQVTTSAVAGASGSQVVSFQRQKRYVRAYATFAGTFTNMLVGCHVFAQRDLTPAGAGGWLNEQGAQ
jgi:hypothetical protein